MEGKVGCKGRGVMLIAQERERLKAGGEPNAVGALQKERGELVMIGIR